MNDVGTLEEGLENALVMPNECDPLVMLTAQVILGSGAGTWGPEDQGRAYYPHLIPLPSPPPPNLFPPSGITAWECLGDANAVKMLR